MCAAGRLEAVGRALLLLARYPCRVVAGARADAGNAAGDCGVMERLWLIRPSSELYSGFEVRPLTADPILRDWREESARLLAPIPVGNVQRAAGERVAWFGPPALEVAA